MHMAHGSPVPSASIVVPTRRRPDYLDVALGSIMPQALAAGAELVVIDDGPDPDTARVAASHGARYVAHSGHRGLNAARNRGLDATHGELVVFVDDDVRARPGWLAALLEAARGRPEFDAFSGPILARLEGGGPRSCAGEGPPITHTDLGDRDREVSRAWGANLAIRRTAFARAGRFDTDSALAHAGNEEEWESRLRTGGGRLLYVAAAAVEHRRAGRDARLPALSRAAYHRGVASRRYDSFRHEPPGIGSELLTLGACIGHVGRRRCLNGVVGVAHSAGRLRAALDAPPNATSGERRPPDTGRIETEDFLSGHSGTIGGRRAILRRAADLALDIALTASGRRGALRRAARHWPPTRCVLVLTVARPELDPLSAAMARELRRSRHRVEIAAAPPGRRGKFENLNLLLADHDLDAWDWLVVADDDVCLPADFLDGLLFVAERFDLALAQPAHRHASHAAWQVTRRRGLSVMHETAFVEIGPVTAFHRRTFDALLPFPALRMGWGLDLHWGALAREHGWRLGVIDALPIGHVHAAAASAYSREEAVAEARAFLAGRSYVPCCEAQSSLVSHRGWRRRP